jgi:hypothetical protein
MHDIQKCYKKHYLVACAHCRILFHIPMRSLSFVPVAGKALSKTSFACPNCHTACQGSAKRWYWWPSKATNIVSRYERDISCGFGRITNLQLHAPNKNIVFFSSRNSAHIRGSFLSEEPHFRVRLSEFCDRQDSTYSIKPFSIKIASKNLLLYKLSDVIVAGTKPFVYLNADEDYALLARSCDFTAHVTYADPFYSFFTFKA